MGHVCVVPGVNPDSEAIAPLAPDEVGPRMYLVANNEEGGWRVRALEVVQEAWRCLPRRAIVEGESDLAGWLARRAGWLAIGDGVRIRFGCVRRAPPRCVSAWSEMGRRCCLHRWRGDAHKSGGSEGSEAECVVCDQEGASQGPHAHKAQEQGLERAAGSGVQSGSVVHGQVSASGGVADSCPTILERACAASAEKPG